MQIGTTGVSFGLRKSLKLCVFHKKQFKSFKSLPTDSKGCRTSYKRNHSNNSRKTRDIDIDLKRNV